MNDHDIRADSFLLKFQNIRIYRVQLRGSGIVYFLKKDDALRYGRELRAALLRKKGVGHE
ncbi:hypothetical protein [Paludibacterium sp.]|uniref:hypothetical protein n=1 Tax=Paludibacterium sp. TaxID=1917523 RepID=UPI0025D3E13A|nr:hypothetical protein [Paludibacterium sp.]MBV8648458.1 hypothetical protein [Paludibacterium sp.]